MAKRKRTRREKRSKRIEKEWKEWGERFGKEMEKRGRNFSEEVEEIVGRHIERRRKEREEWRFRTFGFIGPFIGSVLGIVFLSIGIIILNFINAVLGSVFISMLSNFIFTNLSLFFIIFLFFGYSDYLAKRFPKTFWIASPITGSIGIILALWVLIWVFRIANTIPKISLIEAFTGFVYLNLSEIFVLLVVLGYVILFIKKTAEYSMGH